MSWLAQAATLEEACGTEDSQVLLCRLVYEATDGNEALATAARISSRFVTIVLIVVGAWVVMRLARRAVHRFDRRMEATIQERLDRAVARGAITETTRYRTRRLQRLHAVTGAMAGAIGAIVWISALFWVLSILAMPLQPLLAGAGVVGLVIGFGAQQLVRDVLSGIAMLIEDQYGVGDWIEVEGKIGEVERVGLRSTAFRDLDGTVHHVLNGYIQRVGNLSQHWGRATFDVPLALDADVPTAKAIIYKVATDLAADPVWGEDIIDTPEIWGVQEFGPGGLKIRVVMRTKPLRNWDITRQLRERLKFAFERANIRQPAERIDLGGQQDGFPVLQRDSEQPDGEPRRRRRGLVPPDAGPFDQPPAREEAVRDEGGHAADMADLDDRDQTTELRIDRGPEPRPD